MSGEHFKHPVTFDASTDLRSRLDAAAAERGVPRAALIREAVEAHLGALSKRPRKGGKNCPFLAPDEVARIRARRAAGETLRSIAADFNVSHVAIIKRLRTSPAEATRDDGDGRDSPPSAPVSPSSRVASAGESKHPWRRQGAALAKRPAAMRSRS